MTYTIHIDKGKTTVLLVLNYVYSEIFQNMQYEI